jgi:polysaccharide export outer membrane protein
MLLICGLVGAQTPPPPSQGTGVLGAGAPITSQIPPSEQVGQAPQLRSNYVLRAGDQILIHAQDEEELSSAPRLIDQSGFVDLPLLGKMQAAGISLDNFEAALREALKQFVVKPQVTVTVTQYASEPVYFEGDFKAPGVYSLTGRRNLVEMMAQVGGLQPGASNRIKVTRHKEYGPIPLPNVIPLPDGSTSAEINIKTLLTDVNPAEDIILQPLDIISVSAAGVVYVMGAVGHIGTLALQDRESLPVMQAIIESGGLASGSKEEDSVILRPVADTARHAVIPINVKRILKGEGNDQPLLANDVLVVATSHKFSTKQLLVFLPILGVVLTLLNLFSHL